MDGERLRKNNRGAPWLVLHHEPPPRLSPEAVINTLEKLTWRFTPDYVSCGHFHEGPEVLGRFAAAVRSTVFFNAGANFDALIPKENTALSATQVLSALTLIV